jgi:hypothetical protein
MSVSSIRKLPWAAPAKAKPDRAQLALDDAGREAVIAMVEGTRTRIPSWQRWLANAATEASATEPDQEKLQSLLDARSEGPGDSVTLFADRDEASAKSDCAKSLSASGLLGSHLDLLLASLRDASTWWSHAINDTNSKKFAAAAASSNNASLALVGAMQHALYLTFLYDATQGRTGESLAIADYCQGWGLDDSHVDELWMWITHDGLRLGRKKLPLALDKEHKAAYRKAKSLGWRLMTASTTLWGAAAALLVVGGVFALLHWAGMGAWPADWQPKLLVLFLSVVLGATLHITSRWLNVDFDNPIKVYDAGNLVEWLSLRWLGILLIYVPVTAVVITMWAANDFPTSIQTVGTAILAGYSADSLFKASLSRLQAQAASTQASSTAATASPPPAPLPAQQTSTPATPSKASNGSKAPKPPKTSKTSKTSKTRKAGAKGQRREGAHQRQAAVSNSTRAAGAGAAVVTPTD